jgi:hypothetical protein
MRGSQAPEPQRSEAQADLEAGRWRGVYWYMSQHIKRRYGPDACTPPPPGTPRRKVEQHGDPGVA